MTGITCPACGETARAVVESRRMPDRVRRRCSCTQCGERFTTWELRHDQITAQVDRVAATRAARLLERFQNLQQSMAAMRQLLEAELSISDVLGVQLQPVTCEQCRHWEGCCGLGFPDPLEDGIEFAAECSTFTEAR